jgi:hypothetical protein
LTVVSDHPADATNQGLTFRALFNADAAQSACRWLPSLACCQAANRAARQLSADKRHRQRDGARPSPKVNFTMSNSGQLRSALLLIYAALLLLIFSFVCDGQV